MLVVLPIVSEGQSKPKTVTIKGIVVAEYQGILFHACYHVCGLSLLVKPDKPSSDSKFVVVNVEYMDDHSKSDYGLPIQLIKEAARWKFEATPESGEKMPLQQNMNFVDEKGNDVSKETAIPAWSLLKGAENEKLPFGEPLATYRVKVGKFKSIR